MTEQEALEILNNECEDVGKVQLALHIARKALEKQIPKKIIHHKNRLKNKMGCFITEEYWECPCCGRIHEEYYSFEYCDCGQRLDWGNEDAE